jgi:hypothetical protein
MGGRCTKVQQYLQSILNHNKVLRKKILCNDRHRTQKVLEVKLVGIFLNIQQKVQQKALLGHLKHMRLSGT